MKCKGKDRVGELAMKFKCRECGAGFKTKRGLRQHKRHAHMLLARLEKGCSRREKHKRCWLDKEVERLKCLVNKYKNEKRYSKLIYARDTR